MPQALWCWPGQELCGFSGKVKRGLLYNVQTVSDEDITVSPGEGLSIRLTHKQAVHMLRPSYAMTYASCQGLTLRDRVRLETRSPCLTLKHLYVGVSRATAASLLEVA